ncbi:DUF2586 family protein [Brevibacillus composti]|uniref:DUF2586 family protein n=1 Tax=Brevibacillus composti TaxID=2796470 RepID=A0ABX7ZAW5_9BACL|nr:DUF2586 domain-containing protein [Brevibacillus composti]QUO43455.1 DUF2586 family protein [Brevibacillus composti]
MPTGLPDAKVVIQDGGLGASNDAAGGVHLKIGVCTLGVPNRIYRVSDPNAVASTFGTGELVSALLDSMQIGARDIIVIPAAASIAGTISSVEHIGTGGMTLAVSGQPKNRYDVIVRITKSGTTNEAQYQLSLDGNTFGPVRTVPTDGTIELQGTGLTLQFNAPEPPATASFVEGDEYRFKTTAPQMSIQDFLSAMNVVKNNSLNYEYIHVVGESDGSLWAMCASDAEMLEENHKPIHFICEARRPGDGESLDEWVQDLIEARKSFVSDRVSVVAPLVKVASLDGSERWTNLAGVYAGILARARVSESPGKVMSFPLTNVVALMEGMNNSHIKALDDAGFITARTFEGLPGFYITNGRMMAAPGSDFEFVEIRRTVDKAARLVRQASVRYVQSEADEDGLDNLLANISAPLVAQMMSPAAPEISDFTLTIPEGQDIFSTRSLDVDLAIVPIPIMKWITVRLKLRNPMMS